MTLWLVLLLTALARPTPEGGWPTPPTEGTVASVYDGDTVTLDSGDKIRLRWVNTPELKPPEPFADEARALTERMVLRRSVALAVSPDGRDGYGRVVAGISTDEGDLSLALLEAGLAHVFVIPPDPVDIAPLIAAQERARAQRLGIWSAEGFQAALHMTSFHANAPGPDERNVNGEYLRISNLAPTATDTAGWALRTSRGAVLPLPSVSIPAGYTVQVKAGIGPTQSDPRHQLVVHLGSHEPVFDNRQEVVELLGPDGRAVDRREHHGSE